jgi:hypothetical protein
MIALTALCIRLGSLVVVDLLLFDAFLLLSFFPPRFEVDASMTKGVQHVHAFLVVDMNNPAIVEAEEIDDGLCRNHNVLARVISSSSLRSSNVAE